MAREKVTLEDKVKMDQPAFISARMINSMVTEFDSTLMDQNTLASSKITNMTVMDSGSIEIKIGMTVNRRTAKDTEKDCSRKD